MELLEIKIYKIISWINNLIEHVKQMDLTSTLFTLFILSWLMFMFTFSKEPFNL